MTATTYTIAMDGDVLMATAVDGDDAMMDARLSDVLQHFAAEDRDGVMKRLVYTSNLTLYATSADAEDDDAEVVYSGCDTGWLCDADGRSAYMAAGRKTRA